MVLSVITIYFKESQVGAMMAPPLSPMHPPDAPTFPMSPPVAPDDYALSGYSSDSSLISTASSTVSDSSGRFHDVIKSDCLHCNINEKTRTNLNFRLWVQWADSMQWEAVPRSRMDAGLKKDFDQLIGQQGTAVFVSIIILL